LPTVAFSAPGTTGGTTATGIVNPVRSSANLSLMNTFVGGNSASQLGGGIGNAGAGPVVLTQSTIQDNSTAGFGGGFADQNNLGTLLVQDSLFVGNSAATDGGGLQEGGPTTTIANTEIKSNTAGDDGGGIFADGTTLTITGSTLADNVAAVAGGGLEIETTSGGTQPGSTITNSTITGNSVQNNNSTGAGGGIGAGMSGVLANSSGGSFAFTGVLTLFNDTITSNSADGGGGIAWAGASGFTGATGSAFISTFRVQNTILADNTALDTGPDVLNAAGTFTDLGGNLIGVNNGFTSPTTLTGPFASLVSGLGNNGGPTVGSTGHSMTLETLALPPDSSAIGQGTGTTLATDERGFARIGEPQDSGAFQVQGVTLHLSITATSLNGTDSVVVTVTNTGSIPLPADNSTVTVSLPAGFTAAPGTPLTFTLATLAPGQSAIFAITTTAATPALPTVTVTLTSPDASPTTITASGTVNPAPETNHIPLGILIVFGLGFGPGSQLDAFEVDAQGQVFVQAFSFGLVGTPVYIDSDMFLSDVSIQDNAMLTFLTGADNQRYPLALLNFSNPYVFEALLANLVRPRG
jgi:hypothetical protein